MKKVKQYFPVIQSECDENGGKNLDDTVIQAFEEFLSNLEIKSPKELVLINPPIIPEYVFDEKVARNKGFYIYPPVGLLYIAAAAKEVNPSIKIKIIDLNYEVLRLAQTKINVYPMCKDIITDVIKECEAPHIGFTYMFGATKDAFFDITKHIVELFPKIPIFVGGVQATYDFKELLESKYCNAVFLRESEVQFKHFLENCINEKAPVIPSGIAFRVNDKIYELGVPDADVPVEYDIREFYQYLNITDYYKYGSLAAFSRYNGEEKPFATVLSNRGCRARCTFCTVRNFNGFSVRQRTVQSVIDEIKFLVYEKGIKQIDWLDDDLLWNEKRTIDLFKGLSEQVPELEWICNNGLIAAAISEEIMYWMVKSGMKAFKIGIESGNDKILKEIKKPTTKAKLREKRELFRKYPEVFVSANFILGFPNETFGQMMDSYDFANELKWDWSSFYMYQPLKGTELYSVFQSNGNDRKEVVFNPARAAPRGEFGYEFEKGDKILTGRDIFKIPRDIVPSYDQVKEIWFTYNLVTNFLENYNFETGGNPEKMIKWFESIAQAYPYDASMSAALIRSYKLIGNQEKVNFYKKKFIENVESSDYWKKRIKEFPELLDFAEVSLQNNNIYK